MTFYLYEYFPTKKEQEQHKPVTGIKLNENHEEKEGWHKVEVEECTR